MRPAAALVPLFALLTAVGGLATSHTATPKPDPAPAATVAPQPRVKLAVLVVFDQMRGDYLEKWKPLFGPGGFVRLQTEGAWFTRCYYPYGTTITGPGHASILTGTCPDRHGIVSNEWYENGREVYCAGDERYQLVPAAPPAKPGTKPKPIGTPERLLCETVADVLKRETGGKGKVFGLSLKDRSAILPTGKRPDGAYWFDDLFVTSTYYPNDPHPWVREMNKSKVADKWFGKEWTRFRPDLDYAAYSGPDDVRGEGSGYKQGRTFPHPMTGGEKTPGPVYYDALAASPYGSELLFDLTKRCVTEEKLGADDVPDLLVVSFSSNDLIGHQWGPDSQEVLDITLRSDAMMAQLLGFLDNTVGAGNYVLAVTADHGICPLPEVTARQGQGRPARRVKIADIEKDVEAHLAAKFGAAGAGEKSGWIEKVAFPWLHLNPRVLTATGAKREEVAAALSAYLAGRADVARAYTAADLTGPDTGADEVTRRVRRSYYAPRCGDVYMVLRPYDLPTASNTTGTTHGSPWGYDAHVPLLVMGPGVKGGTKTEATTPQATAAIFARFLGVRPPEKAEFPVPMSLEGK